MVSSLVIASLDPCVKPSSSTFKLPSSPQNKFQLVEFGFRSQPQNAISMKNANLVSSSPPLIPEIIWKSLMPIAASAAIILCSGPANAGFLSGLSGIESVPGPELPQIDFLNRWNDENQKKYAEADARFKESPLLKKLLEQSKLNKEKNRQAVLDKYCIRGAEWGVGDCSADAMSPEDRENFIAMLKKKAGVE